MRAFIKYLTAALILTAQALSASAQSASSLLEGIWNGKISVGQTELTLVFNFQPAEDGSLTATMDSPDQGAEGIEAEIDASALPSVGVKIPSLSASFSGMLYRGSIVGSFIQNGLTFPLTLTRGEEVLNRPQTPQPPFPYRTEEVSFTNAAAGATLAGTLSWPVGCGLSIHGDADGTAPAVVVMVSGSGQQNRDEGDIRPQALPGHRRPPRSQRDSLAALRRPRLRRIVRRRRGERHHGGFHAGRARGRGVPQEQRQILENRRHRP